MWGCLATKQFFGFFQKDQANEIEFLKLTSVSNEIEKEEDGRRWKRSESKKKMSQKKQEKEEEKCNFCQASKSYRFDWIMKLMIWEE